MSTYIYLQCAAHEPKIRSSEPVGSSVSHVNFAHELIKKRYFLTMALKLTEEDPVYVSELTGAVGRAAWFFREHPKCPMEVVDEYGNLHEDLGADKKED